MPAVPLEDEQRRVVSEDWARHGKDIVCQPPCGLADLADQVQRRGTALEHAVGDQDQTLR